MDNLPDELIRAVFAGNALALPICRRFLAIFKEMAAACNRLYVAKSRNYVIYRISPVAKINVGYSKCPRKRVIQYTFTYGRPLQNESWGKCIHRVVANITVTHRLNSSECRVRILRSIPLRTSVRFRARTHTGLENALERATRIRLEEYPGGTSNVYSAKTLAELYETAPHSIVNYALCRSLSSDALRIFLEYMYDDYADVGYLCEYATVRRLTARGDTPGLFCVMIPRQKIFIYPVVCARRC